MNMSRVEDIINELKNRKASIACNGKKGLLIYLKDLGFTVVSGSTPGHKVFTHERLSELSGFISFSIDCGHKPKREMKKTYVVKTISILSKYKDFLS